MRRYAVPLRLTWDWAWPPIAHRSASADRLSPERARAIGAEIVRSRVLLLEVGYPDAKSLLAGEVAAALQGFEGSLSLVLAPTDAAALAAAKPGEMFGAEEVWVDATPAVGDGPADIVGLAGWRSVRFYLTADNLDAVAAGIEDAVGRGARAISLPNLPLFGDVLRGAETVTPPAARFSELAGRIAAALRPRPEVELRVHHYGLWQALRAAGVHPLGEDAAGGGCQAGSALAYVDPTGVLYPCASLPVPLARVGDGSIAEAWGGPILASLREKIAGVPEACRVCPFEPTCRGGCRGWAHYSAADWNATGPDCVRP